jgi:7,8-dihydropterin-6-yl-methyl-4-(beta-D-ribofuranosyl)aminobenzene 5'-phosphate synthase
MRITSIIENNKIKSDSILQCEAGLALYIETTKNKILFDTGLSSKMVQNAKLLGIPLEDVDICIISHGHFDHTGGLSEFLRLNQKARVYMKKGADGKFYFKLGIFKKNVSVPSEVFTLFNNRIIWVDELIQVSDNISIITEIIQKRPLYGGYRKLLIKEGSQFKQDLFSHELIAYIKDKGKSVAFTGCSHNGILNMIDTIRADFPEEEISAIMGGFHLIGIPIFSNSMGSTQDEVMGIGKELLAYNIPKIYTMHCTGMKAFKILKKVMGDTLFYFATGEIVDI